MGDAPRHATWHERSGWIFGALLAVIWFVLASIRWSRYLAAPGSLRLSLALISTAVGFFFLVIAVRRRIHSRPGVAVLRLPEPDSAHPRHLAEADAQSATPPPKPVRRRHAAPGRRRP